MKIRATAITLLFALLLASPGRVMAEEEISDELWNQRHRVELGLYLGALFPPRAHELYDEAPWQKPFDVAALDVGLRLGYLPFPYIGLEIEGGVMPTWTRESDDFALLYTARAHIIGQYPHRFTPFLVVGYGILGVSSDDNVVGSDIDGAFHAGVGLKLNITTRLLARLDGRIIISGQSGPGGLQPHFEALGGLSYALYAGRKTFPDSDGDGVSDDKDKCPNKAAKTSDGCPPPDADGDGLPDSQDSCPKKAANTDDGCPLADGDGDGVPDSTDKCPEVAAKTADGCPADRDGDGVPDDKDRCPDVAAKTSDGCVADGDGDGVPDPDDSCPDDPETKNGYKDDDGCPDTAPPKFTGKLPKVYFQFGRARPRGGDMPLYNRVVKIMKQHPTLRLRLEGFADNIGEADFNDKLSLWRAEEVQKLLEGKGVESGRLELKGMGEQNSGPAARNRRVEFKVIE